MSNRVLNLLLDIVIFITIISLTSCDLSTATMTRLPSTPVPASPPVAPRNVAGTPASDLRTSGVDAPEDIPSCPSDVSTPLFNAIPVEPNDFLALRPLGFLSPPIHMFPAKHSAFSMTPPGEKPIAKPVLAPGKVWVTEIWEASFSNGGANYQVFVYPCRDVRVYFGHIASLSKKLFAQLATSTPNCNSFDDGTATVKTCRHEHLSIHLEGGEALGMGPDTAGVDFGIIDFRRPPAAFVNLAHYDHFYPYNASPLDYFIPELRRTLEGKSGDVFGSKLRTVEPLGGTYMQDIAGTAQGNWFFPGKYHRNTTDLSSALGLVHDYVNPIQPMMAIGNSVIGLKIGLYSFKVEKEGLINRDFSQLKSDGKTYCYETFLQGRSEGGMPLANLNGAMLLSMPSATEIELEIAFASSCQAASNRAFTANATVFVR